MGSPYIGEIRIFAGNFAPQGWAFCDGTLIPISENDTLFNLIGTTYGGDGQETFALPDLRGRVPMHLGNNGTSTYTLAQNGGVETVTLTTQQLPAHTHTPIASNTGGSDNPLNAVWAKSTTGKAYAPLPLAVPNAVMNPAGMGLTGGNQPHSNIKPILGLNFIIALFGIFPSPT